MMHIRRVARCLVVAPLIGMLPVPVYAAGREVLCESKHGSHAYCSTGRHGAVHVKESFGRPPCIEGQTWGTDSGGIWVDQGCYARFWVEDGSSSGSDRHQERAAAGAAIGAIAIAAILAGASNRDSAPAQSAPAAAPAAAPNLVGRFHTFDPQARADTMMDIDPGGRVYYYQLGQRYAGRLQGNHIYFDGGREFTVQPSGTGFVMSQDMSPAPGLTFERVQ